MWNIKKSYHWIFFFSAETKIGIATPGTNNANTIKLSKKPRTSFPESVYGPITEEAYELVITPSQIEIGAAAPKGIINGIHTLISQQAWREVPAQVIKDGPRFAERALQLDIASNFYKPAEIKKIINLMAYYKLNRLYLQIWNNHGLRLDLGLGAVEVRLSVRDYPPKYLSKSSYNNIRSTYTF